MSDVIRVERGFSPWRPAPNARLVKEYSYYEMPLAGVIEQHGVRYYFHCAAGEAEPANFWLYMRLSPEDEATLDAATAEDFNMAVDFTGPGVLALALEGPGIIAMYVTDGLSGEELELGFLTLRNEFERLVETVKELVPG